MPLFIVYSLDDPATGKEIRKRTRGAHLRYVADKRKLFQYGGSLIGESGEMIGTVQILEVESRQALDRFLSEDPYNQNKLFANVIITETRKSLPESRPGELDEEMAKAEARAR
jgi:uncharacterized protein YciI